MKHQGNAPATTCPDTSASARTAARAAFDDVLRFCETCDEPFWVFEKELLCRIAAVGTCLIQLFLTARHERLKVQPFLQDAQYRHGDAFAERTLKTVYGAVTYGRRYLIRAARRQRLVPPRCDARFDAGPPVALGHAMAGTPGDAHEFQGDASGVQGGTPLGTGHGDDRTGGAGHGMRGGTVHEGPRGPRWRRRGTRDRSRWQVPTDGNRGRVGPAARQCAAAPCAGLRVRLPASSRSGEAAGAGEQRASEKRGQEQEWHSSESAPRCRDRGLRAPGALGLLLRPARRARRARRLAQLAAQPACK